MSKVSVTLTMDLDFPMSSKGEVKLRRQIRKAVAFEGISDVLVSPVREVMNPHDVRVAGGKARANKMSASERKAIASLAAKARWAKNKERKLK